MKKFIRVLAMLMTLCMLVSVFAACSKNESVDTDAISTDAPAADDQPAEEGEVIKVMNKDAFLILVKGINENPESSKGKTYKLMADIDLHSGWNSSPTEKLGQFVAPDAITAFAGISEFYGVFDGNGKTISGVYMSESAEAGDNVAFIRKLNGGTVKNLVINNAFVMDNGAKGATVSGLVGTVNGDNAVIENVTVNAGVYSATNAEATVAGIVGKVEAENLTVKDVTFGGKAGNVTEALSVNATSTAAVLAQIIADGGDKTIAMSGCKANGAILANDGATKDAFCAKGASKLTKTDCTITAPEGDGGVEDTLVNIYTAEEFKYLAAANSTFAGKTIKLMKSIDLNPEWEANTVAPANVWTPIASFAGTFDGNGQTISGIYGESFITALNGGTVKNLLVLNSVFVSDSAANVGFIGTVNGGNVSDIFSEATVAFTGTANANVGGIAGKTEGASTFDSIVFAGVISADGKTTDLIANGTATYSNILAVGTGATTAATGTCVLTEKKDASYITSNAAYAEWKYVGYVESIAPASVAEKLRFLALTPDTSWYSATATTFEISTPEQLMGLSVLAQEFDFANQTIKLTADIDLNPAWDATTLVSSAGKVTLADPANNVWTSIPVFKGTFDGQGHSISGLYNEITFTDTVVTFYGGFIHELIDGAVKNLIVDNSLVLFKPASDGTNGTSTKIRTASFIGRSVDSDLMTLFIDIDAWAIFRKHYGFGGIVNSIEAAGTDRVYLGTIENLVYAGSFGRIIDGFHNAVADNPGSQWRIGFLVGCSHNGYGDTQTKVTMKNLSFIGNFYAPEANQSVWLWGDSIYSWNGSDNTNILTIGYTLYYNYVAGYKDGMSHADRTLDSVIDLMNGDKIKEQYPETVYNATYGDSGFKTYTIENGAGITDPILLPGTVVDMLIAHNG